MIMIILIGLVPYCYSEMFILFVIGNLIFVYRKFCATNKLKAKKPPLGVFVFSKREIFIILGKFSGLLVPGN
jgi:hypothetical protein